MRDFWQVPFGSGGRNVRPGNNDTQAKFMLKADSFQKKVFLTIFTLKLRVDSLVNFEERLKFYLYLAVQVD